MAPRGTRAPEDRGACALFLGRGGPLVKIAWADRLGEYFSNYSFAAAEGAGHFVHYEKPEAANREIAGFFSSHGSSG